jgi:endonuclease-3
MVEYIVSFLEKKYRIESYYSEPFRVLISTILSHRTRDEITFSASDNLFSVYKTPQQLAEASVSRIEERIKPCGFYKVKAKRIKEVCRRLIEDFKGEVPSDIDDLLSLPGVGRKTANCVLAYGFRRPALAVDTHVHRITNRLGLVDTKTPYQTEQALCRIVDERYRTSLNALLVRFGQDICRPQRPRCKSCDLKKVCRCFKDRYLKIEKEKG